MENQIDKYTDGELIERRDNLTASICKVQEMINRQPDLSYARECLIEDKHELQADLKAIEQEITERLKSNEPVRKSTI